MPNVNDIFPSKFLHAHDLQGRAWTLTIARVEFEVMGRTRETLPVVYFRGRPKGLKLNKTNATAITAVAGSALTEEWPGVVVTIYASVADFGGQSYNVVRVRAAKAPEPRPLPPPPVDDLEIDLHDGDEEYGS
jgi:hypothetical protein